MFASFSTPVASPPPPNPFGHFNQATPAFAPSVRSTNFQATVERVKGMVGNSNAQALAKQYSLAVQNVAWEDNARNKGSAFGPCISDLTLQVDTHRLPLVRPPNFSDVTWDVPMDNIPLRVGNHNGSSLQTVSLTHYLKNLRSYMSRPDNWKGFNSSLHAPARDSHVIMSAQACFLPVPQSEEAKFNVALFNYQASATNPCVLCIVATSKGTSMQVLTQAGFQGQKLYFNNNGSKCSFIGQRLKDNRRERGVALEGEMSAQEKQDNVIVVIQVPLKRKHRQPSFGGNGSQDLFCMGGTSGPPQQQSTSGFNFGGLVPAGCPPPQASCPPPQARQCAAFGAAPPSVGVEEAIVKIGESEGRFQELPTPLEMERDTSYPVRVTLQFYKSTDNGEVNAEVMAVIAKQISDASKSGEFVGSLVTGGSTLRPTEMHAKEHGFINSPFQSCDKHPGIVCDGCGQGIGGKVRFKCTHCVDFDLCGPCEATGKGNSTGNGGHNNTTHLFLKILDSRIVTTDSAVITRNGRVHYGHSCSNCGTPNIVGTRYSCQQCFGVHMCEPCETRVGHAGRAHPMVKFFFP